jgi:tetratricopeptide (TPR) repeat protein
MFIRQSLKRLRPLASRKASSHAIAPSFDIAVYQPSSSLMFPSSQLSQYRLRSIRRYFSAYRQNPDPRDFLMDTATDKKERFDPSLTASEWKARTIHLLDVIESPVGSLSSLDLCQAEETIRWWTTQRTAEGVTAAFHIFGRIAVELEKSPHLLNTEDLIYWLDGRYPRSTHLLNAALDAWRIVWESGGSASNGVVGEEIDTLPPEQVLLSVERLAAATNTCPVPLNERTYSIIMNAAVKRGDSGTPIFTERILETMLVESGTNPAVMPDTVAFTTAIRAWAISGRPDAAHRAEGLWREMLSLVEDQVIDAQPNTVMYNTVLDALVRSNTRAGMERADEILRQMMTSPYQDVYPDTVSFRLVIFGWTELMSEEEEEQDSADRAYSLLSEMLRLYETGSSDVDVDASFFSKLISTLARFGTDYQKAQDIYDHLLELYERTGDPRFEPDIYTTRAMVIVYSKQNRPEMAEPLLVRLEHEAESSGDLTMMPKRGHYRDVLLAWTRSCNKEIAVERAEGLLLRMIDLALKVNKDMVPDGKSINTVLHMWSTATSQRKDAAQRAESLLRTIQGLHDKTRHQNYKMGSSSFLSVITAWSRSNVAEASDRAEALLFEMQRRCDEGQEDLRPDRFHYASVITAWGKSGRYDASDSLDDIFEEAVDAYKAGHLMARPDTALYGATIHACAQIGDAERAEHYLQRMLKDYKQGNESAKPSSKVFNAVLLAWLRSGNLKAPERAEALFRAMQASNQGEGSHVRPDKQSFGLMIEILSNSQSKDITERASHYSQQLKTFRDSVRI